SAPGRFAAFDDLVTLTVRTLDGDERHGPFLPKGSYEDEAQCDINRSSSPLLKHYRILQHEIDHLNGTLYLDRMAARSFMTSLNYTRLWQEKAVEQVWAELGLP